MPGTYKAKPNTGFKMSGHKCWIECWEDRMRKSVSMVNVWLSTDPQCEHTPWKIYSRHEKPKHAVLLVLQHLHDFAELGCLQPGMYTIECGELRRTLEVDANA